MKRSKKLKYEAPAIDVMLVELEQGIAAASSPVSGGEGTTPDQPGVEDWQTGGLDTQTGDL